MEKKKNKHEYINNVSIHRLVKNLSPFLINEHNLTFEGRNILLNNLNEICLKFNSKLGKMADIMKQYSKVISKLDESINNKKNNLSESIKSHFIKKMFINFGFIFLV